jgi:type VI secretion system protein ImpA
MASAPLLDFTALIAPIPGDSPAGSSMPLTVRQELETLRKEFEPHPENPSLPPIPKKPDWPKIRRRAEEVLTETSKDLETTFRLTEALVKLEGFAGLRDGLHLLYELADQCWDRLHPMPDEGEGMEVRAERFYWLLDPDKGARFPYSVRGIPVVNVKGEQLSYRDFVAAMQGEGAVQAAAFEGADLLSPDISEDVAQCVTELNQLERILAEKCAPDPPGLMELRSALDDCQRFIQKMTRTPAPTGEEASATNGAMPGAHSGGGAPVHVGTSRDELYRQLAHIAAVLEKLEPHSPIPDLLRRAIELGRMPFRQLIHELVREPNLLAEVRREFGIKEEPTSS